MKLIDKLYNLPDSKLSIIWFSDIHFIEKLPSEEYFENFVKSFKEKCKEIINEREIIMLISGDIAQEGKTEEYRLFWEKIINPIVKANKNIKILTLPGNHDLELDKIENIKDLLVAEKKTKYKKNYLENSINHSLFNNYTSFFIEKINYFPVDDLSNNYKNHFYNGYYKSDKNKVFIILVNSAWFSYAEKIIIHILDEDSLNSKDKASKIVDSAVDYQNQILAIKETFLEIDELLDDIKKHKEYVVFFAKHHSENWLEWTERIDSDEMDKNLKMLNNLTNIFLDSHEHVHHKNKPTQHENKIVYLKSGPFIELKGNKIRENKLSSSQFALLEINSTRKILNYKNHVYNISSQKWDEVNDQIIKLEKEKIPIDFEYLKEVKIKLSSCYNTIEKLSFIYEEDINDQKTEYINSFDKKYNVEYCIEKDIENLIIILFDVDYIRYYKKLKIEQKEDRVLAVTMLKNDINIDFLKFKSKFYNSLKVKNKDIEQAQKINLDFILIPYFAIKK